MFEDSNGIIRTTHEEISQVAVEYFQTKLGKSEQMEDFPIDIELPQLSDEHKALLGAPFTE